MKSSSSRSSLSSDDSEASRGNWTGKLDFMMSCISYAVGLGNIWRFPYLCYRNGGAVFLIPYLIFLYFCAMPLFFFEISFGQFASLSPITIWRISPIFKGLGYGMIIVSGIVCVYYNIIITWAAFYFLSSFSFPVLPWSTCDNDWNTDRCVSAGGGRMQITNVTLNGTQSDVYEVESLNTTVIPTDPAKQLRSSSEEYWENRVLQITDGIDNAGGIRWELFGLLALSWTAIFFCLIKGVRSSGKVVYVTAILPYIVLFIFLLRGVTLPGAIDGILFYVVPRWHMLLRPQVWGEAAMQIFFSIGPCWGGLITMASYNKFHNNVYRDARLLPVLNSSTSIFAGFVIFSIIGFMAHETGVSVDKVVTQGPGLVFVVYPEAMSRLPFSHLWSLMFFFMLLLLGVGTQMATFQTVTSCFIDEFEVCRKRKVITQGVLCVLSFLFGIPCITRGGIYVLQILDWYTATFSLMVISFCELMVIGWVYGVKRFSRDIELMVGYFPSMYWHVLWCFVTPSMILLVFGFSVFSHTPVTYGSYAYPAWAVGLGWVITMSSVVPLPLFAGLKVYKAEGTFMERLRKVSQPTDRWGPALDKNRKLYLASLNESNPHNDGAFDSLTGNGKNGLNSDEKKDIQSIV